MREQHWARVDGKWQERLRGQWEEVHEPLETAEAQIYHCQGIRLNPRI